MCRVAGKPIAKGCAAVVYTARSKREVGTEADFPLAIKMMFNFHAESNAFTILRAMHRYSNMVDLFRV